MAIKGGIDISLEVNAPKVSRTYTVERQIGQWRQKYQRKSSLRVRTYHITETYDLSDIISELIANRVQNYMIEYAPIDESPNRDNIVLKENIEIWKQKDGQFVVGSKLPYATRRNYENFKNPDTLHYVERSYQNHESEYEDIAKDITYEYIDTYVGNIIANLNSSSGAKNSTNWGTESFRL